VQIIWKREWAKVALFYRLTIIIYKKNADDVQNYRNDRIYHFKKVFSTSRQNAIYKMLSNDARTKLGIEAVDRKVKKTQIH